MTRSKVIQLGILVLAIGGLTYLLFSMAGLDNISAGIAAQSILFLALAGWTGSYLLRVVSGNMTFIQQRRRYEKAYEDLTKNEIKAHFDALPEEEQNALLQDLDDKKGIQQSSTDK